MLVLPELAIKVHIFWEGNKVLRISTFLLSYIVPVKSKVELEISQNFVAFIEYTSFKQDCQNVFKFLQALRFSRQFRNPLLILKFIFLQDGKI